MKIVVTGATGHIGSYVIRDLAYKLRGSEIIMIDDMRTQRYSSLYNLPSIGHYTFHDIDITSVDIRPIIKNTDVLIHLAAITDATGSINNADQIEKNNYIATQRVAESCIETGVRVVILSSTSVYGTNKEAVSENCSPDELQPQSPYSRIKLNEEKLINQLCMEKNLNAIICRFGTIFGASPGMRFHTAINKFCWQAVMGQPITIWSTAFDQQRPYLDLIDASQAIAFIIENDLFDGHIYNISTLNSTVRHVIDTIREFVPKVELAFIDNQVMNNWSYGVSCERFKNHGFAFTGDLGRGIEETIALLRNANT